MFLDLTLPLHSPGIPLPLPHFKLYKGPMDKDNGGEN